MSTRSRRVIKAPERFGVVVDLPSEEDEEDQIVKDEEDNSQGIGGATFVDSEIEDDLHEDKVKDVEENLSDSDEEYGRVKKTKKQKGKQKQKEVIGQLKVFLTMPADIFVAVCAYLPPQDLLAFSRSSKLFKSLLISHPSIWLVSLDNSEVPRLEIPFSHPIQLASLLFDKFCMICGVEDLKNPKFDFNHRVRCCKPCRASKFVGISASGINPSNKHQVEKLLIGKSCNFGYDRATCRIIIDKYDKLHKENFINSLTRKSTDGAETLQSFVRDRQEYVGLLYSDGEELQDWYWDRCDQEEDLKREKIFLKREKYRLDLEMRFLDLGYEEEDLDDPQWQSTETYLHPRRITKAQWITLSPILTNLLDRIKASRLYRESLDRRSERKRLLVEYFENAFSNAFISESQFSRIPCINAALNTDQLITQEKLGELTSFIEQNSSLVDLENQNKGELVAVITAARRDAIKLWTKQFGHHPEFLVSQSIPDDSFISFVTSKARCNGCDSVHSLSALPQHVCEYPLHSYLYGNIQMDPLRIKTIWILLKLMGLKEEDTTEEDLGSIGDRFLCSKCQDGLGMRMYWTGALDHAMTVHGHESNPPAFKLAGP